MSLINPNDPKFNFNKSQDKLQNEIGKLSTQQPQNLTMEQMMKLQKTAHAAQAAQASPSAEKQISQEKPALEALMQQAVRGNEGDSGTLQAKLENAFGQANKQLKEQLNEQLKELSNTQPPENLTMKEIRDQQMMNLQNKDRIRMKR